MSCSESCWCAPCRWFGCIKIPAPQSPVIQVGPQTQTFDEPSDPMSSDSRMPDLVNANIFKKNKYDAKHMKTRSWNVVNGKMRYDIDKSKSKIMVES